MNKIFKPIIEAKKIVQIMEKFFDQILLLVYENKKKCLAVYLLK